MFVSAYRAISIRYIVYSGILDPILASGARVVLFVQDQDADYFRAKLAPRGIHVEPVLSRQAFAEAKGSGLALLFLTARQMTTGQSRELRNPTLDVLRYIHREQLAGSRRGRMRYRLARLMAAVGCRSRVARKAFLALESALFPGRLYDAYFARYRPAMLLISSVGYMIDPLFMRAARRFGCPIVSIVHGWDNPSTKGYRGVLPDRVVVWNEHMRREVRVFHDIPDRRVFVGGVAHWDPYFNGAAGRRSREDFLRAHGLDQSRRLLFYATSSFRYFPRTFDVIEDLLAAAAAGKFREPVQLLVRPHPMYLAKAQGSDGALVVDRYRERMRQLEGRYPGLVRFALPRLPVLLDEFDLTREDMLDLAEMIHHSDVVLTEYSTVLLEAAIFDRPAVNVALHTFRDTARPATYFETYLHLQRVFETGACRSASTFAELVAEVDRYLEAPGRERAQRRALVDSILPVQRGTAALHIGRQLLAWLEEAAGAPSASWAPEPRVASRPTAEVG